MSIPSTDRQPLTTAENHQKLENCFACTQLKLSLSVTCRYLRDHARTIAGKSQLIINAYAKALEVIPRQLCDNSGFDATDVLNKLRQKHALKDGSGKHFGVDVNGGKPLSPPALTTANQSTALPSNPPCCIRTCHKHELKRRGWNAPTCYLHRHE